MEIRLALLFGQQNFGYSTSTRLDSIVIFPALSVADEILNPTG
jgi:hypothetical protein